ncbi:MAG: hypothetical protein Edafosvirus4_14 [Edafosvirus sp.]|uniref:Right handed beta helix domain-containing protein n=1 Tax=Edafosvirus sp. TaxID=2487765 RepID=A0A3G4ZT01_9VIRU|nr:MAG: hypothetical protein Edafosvirus4_14 [Edafosvirus sp.]
MYNNKLIITLVILCISSFTTHAIGYNDSVKIGPDIFIIGYNLSENDFLLSNQTYLVNNTSDISLVLQSVIDGTDQIGGTILLKEGTYVLNQPIVLKNLVHLKGEGIDETIIIASDYGSQGLIQAQTINNTAISNMTLDGNKYLQNNDNGKHGIDIQGCNNVYIGHLKIVDFQGHGIYAHGMNELIDISNIVSKNNDLNGITIIETYIGLIQNSIIINNSCDGIRLVCLTTSAKVTNSHISNNNGDGISINQSYPIILMDNVIENNDGNGIFTDNSNDIIVRNNTIMVYKYHYYGCNILVQNSDINTIDIYDNKLFGGKSAGICIINVQNTLLDNNIIDDMCMCYIFNSSSIVMTNNICNAEILYQNDGTSSIQNINNIYQYTVCSNMLNKTKTNHTKNSHQKNGTHNLITVYFYSWIAVILSFFIFI